MSSVRRGLEAIRSWRSRGAAPLSFQSGQLSNWSMIEFMSFWPGVDGWPPPRRAWIAAATVTAVAIPLIAFGGAVGGAIYAVFLVICLVAGANQRLKNLDAEAFWNSRPKD
jgi:hypothetical protein